MTLARRGDEVEQQVTDPTSDDTQFKQRNELTRSGDGPTSQFSRQENDVEPQGCVVKKIVSYNESDEGTLYCIRSHGYQSQDDTWWPPANIQQHFIARYKRRTQRKQ